jgi:hypothetical protein
MNQTESGQLMIEESRDALQSIRRSLIELYGGVGADPEAPQEVSKRYGINRNLAWRLSRVINATEPFSTLNHLPGQQGIELAIQAFKKAGVSEDVVKPVREAVARLNEVILHHADGRDQLELTLESMGLFERDTASESGWELAYRGESMVWGVQAATRWSATFFAPGAAADTVDMTSIAGIVGFRRLRPTVQWRLQRTRLYDDKGAPLRPDNSIEEFEPKGPGDVPQQIREFCSPNAPDLVVTDTPDGREVRLPGGPVGNRGSFDIYTGSIMRGLPRYRMGDEKMVSKATSITLPCENLVVDLIIHKDIGLPPDISVALNGFPHGHMDDPRARTICHALPIHESFVELAGSPPAVSTVAVPRITQMVERVFSRMNWNPANFRGVRLQMKYPPMSSILVASWPLKERPNDNHRA